MKKSLFIIAVAALAIVLTTVFAITNQGKKSSKEVDLTHLDTVTMDIRNFAYEQPNITVRKGTTVTWTNQDTMEHNVMEAHDGDEQAHTAPRPDEVDPNHFVGPMLKKGESYSFTFTETGPFPYHCAPHPYMTGSVTVVE